MSIKQGISKYWKKPKVDIKDPSLVKCLCCNNEFQSFNKKINRVCPTCSLRNSQISAIELRYSTGIRKFDKRLGE